MINNINIKRQVVLDTETTGINRFGIHYEKHRIIEIGAVEIINRRLTNRTFHTYLKPDCLINSSAFNIHGISNEFLLDKPKFLDIVENFLNFIKDSELIIHNAPFDIGFLENELKIINHNITKIDSICKITDSLTLARKIFPGKRNSLNALCDRYLINKDKRIFHGALLDAEILADIFLLMTSSQKEIFFKKKNKNNFYKKNKILNKKIFLNKKSLKIIYANNKEIKNHLKNLNLIKKQVGFCLWLKP